MTAEKKAAKTKKSSVPKTEAKNSAEINALIKEISGMLKKLTLSDLKYLLQQAKILMHNNNVSAHNKNVIAEYNKNITKKQAEAKKPSKPVKNEITIKEGKENSYFFIRINHKSSSFVLQEMRRLVKISHSGSEKQSGVSLYNYLKKERSDVIETQHITGPNDTKLSDLAKFLKNRYTVNS